MTKDETTNRPRSRLRDYAGLAALVTALGAVAFGVVDRVGQRDHTDRMQRSIFNAGRERIAVLEYRVKQLETRCGGEMPPPSSAPVRAPASVRAAAPRPTHAARPPRGEAPEAPSAAPMATEDADEALVELDAEAAGEAMVEAAPPSYDDIQQIVQSGKVYGDAPIED